MGLDQCAFRVANWDNMWGAVKTKDSRYRNPAQKIMHEWRKHPNLQGWMENLWREKGGEGDFNCQKVELTEQDLLNLKSDVVNGSLPETTGFFYGSPKDDEYQLDDLLFIVEAINDIKHGYTIFYDSWW